MHIVLCVTNDIVTDRRVHRIALSLRKRYGHVTVIGRYIRKSLDITGLSFKTHRIHLLFKHGPFFYSEYNIRLLLRLLFIQADIMVANDLDTLPAVFMASRIRSKHMLYDSHEYFTEVPELADHHLKRGVWHLLERWILPKITFAYTVSDSIALAYKQKYGLEMRIIRNFPPRIHKNVSSVMQLKIHNEKIILYQGSLNKGRGLELAIHAIFRMHGTRLIIIGSGDVEKNLKSLVKELGIEDRVSFKGRIMPDDMMKHSVQADLGISLERDTGLSYRYALPNKLFDYIQAELPVVVSDLPEMTQIVDRYKIGTVTNTNDPDELAALLHDVLHDKEKRDTWKINLKKAAEELCWENEEPRLLELYDKAIGNS